MLTNCVRAVGDSEVDLAKTALGEFAQISENSKLPPDVRQFNSRISQVPKDEHPSKRHDNPPTSNRAFCEFMSTDDV